MGDSPGHNSASRRKSKSHHVIITFAINRNEILISATTWAKREMVMLSEIAQTQKDKHSTYKQYQD